VPETIIFIVNGKPQSGKDCLIGFMEDALSKAGISSDSFHTIVPVRNVLSNLGVQLSEKLTTLDRALLSEVGASLQRHSQYRTKKAISQVEIFKMRQPFSKPKSAFFLHLRESENINLVREHFKGEVGSLVVRVQVFSTRAIVADNDADNGANDGSWDFTVRNDGTLGALYDKGVNLLKIHGLI
jgi:hypothetical protein